MNIENAINLAYESKRQKNMAMEIYLRTNEDDLLEIVGFLAVIEGYFKNMVA